MTDERSWQDIAAEHLARRQEWDKQSREKGKWVAVIVALAFGVGLLVFWSL